MALRPIRNHIPLEIAPSSNQSVVIEATMSVGYLLQPQLYIWNTGSVDVTVTMTQTLDFGPSMDPLANGTYTRTIIAPTVVSSAGLPIANEDITGGIGPDGIIQIFKTVGAAPAEGTLNVPAQIPISIGSVTISWNDGVARSMTDLPSGGWDPAGDGLPVNSSIDYVTGEIILDTGADISLLGTLITLSYTPAVPTVLDLPFEFLESIRNDISDPSMFHEVTIYNNDTVDSVIVRLLLSGMYDEVLKTINSFITRP
jgi:hypothetical protein